MGDSITQRCKGGKSQITWNYWANQQVKFLLFSVSCFLLLARSNPNKIQRTSEALYAISCITICANWPLRQLEKYNASDISKNCYMKRYWTTVKNEAKISKPKLLPNLSEMTKSYPGPSATVHDDVELVYRAWMQERQQWHKTTWLRKYARASTTTIDCTPNGYYSERPRATNYFAIEQTYMTNDGPGITLKYWLSIKHQIVCEDKILLGHAYQYFLS